MIQNYNLKGLRILNPRAAHQAHTLNEQIKAARGVSVPLPLLNILPVDANQWISTLPPLSSVAIAIFCSANAVENFFAGLQEHKLRWPDSIQTLAIGPATAKALSEHNINALYPEHNDSEHLLTMPVLANPPQKPVLLIKGLQGRTLIQETLVKKRVQVCEVSVYRRELDTNILDQSECLWRNDAVDIILGTSQFVIESLFSIMNGEGKNWLRSKPWIVLSPRLKILMHSMGVKNVQVSDNTRLLKVLDQFRQGLKE